MKKILAFAIVLYTGLSAKGQGVVPDNVERDALLALYNSTDGANWNLSQRWPLTRINSYPDSALVGVQVVNGDIESIIIYGARLNGTLPAELNSLTELQALQIGSNPQLADSIPYLGSLHKLVTLDLSYNGLSGKLPVWINQLTTLRYLTINGNALNGPIDSGISALVNLQSLSLNGANLSMNNAVPSTLGNLPSLSYLSLESCSLVPSSFSNGAISSNSLNTIDLSYNHGLVLPDGSFADVFSVLPSLLSLTLRGEDFLRLPSHIKQIAQLSNLDLSYNNFSDSTVIASVVDTLKSLSHLNTLQLFSCQIQYLSSNFKDLSSLQSLYLASNPNLQVQGISVLGFLPKLNFLYMYNDGLTDLPASFANLTTLHTLYLVNNHLNPVPTVIKNIPDLNNLYLNSNGITSLPAWFGSGSTQSINYLELADNSLTLPLPDSLQYLTNLYHLNLANNNLTGALPSYFSGFTKMSYLDMSYNKISSPLPDLSNWTSLTDVHLQHNSLSGTVPSFLSNNPVRKNYVDLSFNKFDSLAAFHSDPNLTVVVNNNKLDFVNILMVARPIRQYIYIPQDTIVFPTSQVTSVKAYVGDSLILTTTVDTNTTTPSQYQWYRYVDGVHDVPVSQPSASGSTYIDPSFSGSEAGKYYVKITNPAAPGLSLVSPFITVTISPCVTDMPLYFSYQRYICAFQFSPPSNTINCKSVSYRWDFGDNTSSSLKNPVHGFKNAGTYTVSLSLGFKCGTACGGDTLVVRQVTYDPNASASFFKDSLVQVSSDVRSKVLSASMTTFADSWPLQHASQSLSDKNSFFNGTQGVWRNDGNYVYKVNRGQSAPLDISKDGTFDIQSFNWQQAGYDVIPNWIKTNAMTHYSPFSYELENKDVLGVYSAALYDYGGHLPSANGVNMRNNEMAFTSFEYLDGHVTGNLIFGTDPVPSYSFYDVKTGFNGVAIIAKPISQLQQFPDATVIARRFGIPNFFYYYYNNYFNYVQNDSVVCRQQYPNDHSKSVLVFQKAPFSGIWTGSIAVRNTIVPVVTPDIDNSFSHSGKSSLSISTPKSFKQNLLQLDSGKQYHINLWVSVNNPNVTTPKLADGLGVSIVVRDAKDNARATFAFEPSGTIIEGWQQIKGTFTCPINNSILELVFKPGSTGHAWYDDLRLHPELGNMKAYVYDLNDYSLRATLDEENFASFYFYDKEGKLYLVKKETEKGIKTISENVNYIVERK